MAEEQRPADPRSTRKRRALTTLLIPAFCWAFGFLAALATVHEKGEATMIASAWAVASVVGWGIFNVFWTPTRANLGRIWSIVLWGGVPIVRKTAEPWPFPSRLAFATLTTVLLVLLDGPLQHRGRPNGRRDGEGEEPVGS